MHVNHFGPSLCHPAVDLATVDITLAIWPGPRPITGAAAAVTLPGARAPTGAVPATSNSSLEVAGPNTAPPSAPWLSSPSLARLDPGLIAGRSLTQRVQGGTATWSQVAVRGWPGQYHLLFTATASGPLAALAQVGSLNTWPANKLYTVIPTRSTLLYGMLCCNVRMCL